MSKTERNAILTDREKACLERACSFPLLKRCSCGKEFRCIGKCPFGTRIDTYSNLIQKYCFCKPCLLSKIGDGGKYVKERLKCYLDWNQRKWKLCWVSLDIQRSVLHVPRSSIVQGIVRSRLRGSMLSIMVSVNVLVVSRLGLSLQMNQRRDVSWNVSS